MTTSQDIRRALETTLNNGVYTNLVNANDISWENRTFDPQGKSLWIAPRLNVTNKIPSVIGSGNAEYWSGVFVVNCYASTNEGGYDLDVLVDEIMGEFPYGTQITENGKIINIRFSQRSGFFYQENWVYCSVSMTWYAYI